ncbi:hypothetical protein [Mesoflavibacter zeaxanthinifaciens]|uniref:hypothetical protein n=1 Tax=Mesoflavibacter zeaxanthinifaciens TaxID=393060 RepID=UPI0026EACAFA|nr:hypothetical protein [Mesoflavibacter zeaxanthinifaciens]
MKRDVEMYKLKVYTIKKLKALQKLIEENQQKDWLTVNEITEDFNISRKTFDRLREKGLKVSQPKRNGKILVERKEIVNFLNR